MERLVTLIKLPLLVALSFVVVGCGGELLIESPQEGEVLSDRLIGSKQFIVTYDEIETGSLKLRLNGNDVTDRFSIEPQKAQAPLETLLPFLQDGNNLFEVSAPQARVRGFVWDASSPALHITELTIENGQRYRVNGYLRDDSGVEQLSINETSIDLLPGEDNRYHFYWDFDPLQTQTAIFHTVDQLGFERNDTYMISRSLMNSLSGNLASQPLAIRVNRSGLDFIEGELLDYSSELNLEQTVLEQNPLVYERKDFEECVDIPIIGEQCIDLGSVWIRVEADALSHSIPALDLQTVNNTSGLEVILSMDQLNIELDTKAYTFGIDYSLSDVSVTAQSLRVLVGLNVIPDNNGQLQAEVKSVDVNLNIDLGALEKALEGIDDVVSYIGLDGITESVKGRVNEAVASQVEDELVSVLPLLIADKLQMVPVVDNVDIGHKSLQVTAIADSLLSKNGGLNITLGTGIVANTSQQFAFGNLVQTSSVPPLTEALSPTGRSYDLGVVIPQGVFNEALTAAFESGLLEVNQLVFSGADLAEVTDQSVAEGDQVQFNVSALSPGFVEFASDGGSSIELNFYDLIVGISVRQNGESVFYPWVEMNIDLAVTMSVSIVDQHIELGLKGVPNVHVGALEVLGQSYSTSTAQKLIQWLMPQLIPQLTQSIAAVPIPEVSGYRLEPVEFWATDKANLALAFNLKKL